MEFIFTKYLLGHTIIISQNPNMFQASLPTASRTNRAVPSKPSTMKTPTWQESHAVRHTPATQQRTLNPANQAFIWSYKLGDFLCEPHPSLLLCAHQLQQNKPLPNFLLVFIDIQLLYLLCCKYTIKCLL